MGSQDSTSTSAPVTAEDRLKSYNAGMGAMNPNYASYDAPQTERLSADYDQLQGDLTKGYTAGLDYAKAKDIEGVNQGLASRGIWSTGMADKAVQDREAAYAPQYAAAGANATNARYGLQTADIAGANANKMAVADKQYESKWRPEDYKAGVWNGTGGVVSSSTSGGWSI